MKKTMVIALIIVGIISICHIFLSFEHQEVSDRQSKKIYKKYSITTEKDSSFDKKAEKIVITYDVHERLVDVFAYCFEHSLISGFELSGTEAVLVTDESPKPDGFDPDATMHIDIQPLYRERQDGYQAIVGTKFNVILTDTATGKEVWHQTGKVDYIRMFGPHYRAGEGIRKEFAWHTTEAIVSPFEVEVNDHLPARIYTVTEVRQKYRQRTDWKKPEGSTSFYALVTVNGSNIPGMVNHGGHDIMLHSGVFTINADGTCTSETVFGSQKVSRVVTATITREGSTLNMQWKGAGRTKGTIEGDTFTMNNEGMVFIYKKMTALPKRDINADFQGGTYVHSLGAKVPDMWNGGGGSFHYENDGSNGYIVLSNSNSDWTVAHTKKPAISLGNLSVTSGKTVTFGADIIKLAGGGSVELKLEEYKDLGTTANGISTKQISPTDSWATYNAEFKIKPNTDSVILVLVAKTKGASYGFDNVTFTPIAAHVKE